MLPLDYVKEWTEAELAKRMIYFHLYASGEKCSCDECLEAYHCCEAYDTYNTDGDCLLK